MKKNSKNKNTNGWKFNRSKIHKKIRTFFQFQNISKIS